MYLLLIAQRQGAQTSRLNVSYPDPNITCSARPSGPARQCQAGRREGDIVGFTTIRPDKGFSLNYSAADRTINRPGHYSASTAPGLGPADLGQAHSKSPADRPRVDDKGDIDAEGVDEPSTAVFPTCSTGGSRPWPTNVKSTGSHHSARTPGVQRNLPLSHRRKRLQGIHRVRRVHGRYGANQTSSAWI